ncbi:MAG: TonB-dependent receptor [Saprospiraceae bacterium]|nr:TonB-dependent receptor [Saprospiraceae bacterium]
MNTFKQQATPAKVLFCATMCCLFSTIVQAQTIRGAVRNTDNGQPIAGATVVLRNAIAPFGGATDSTGQFVFQNMRPGYYSCEITAIGFEGQIIPEINLTAGKEQVLTIALRRSANELPELVVTANKPGYRAPQQLAEIPLSRDQTLRFPATFFDPARLAMAYPGVSGNDDQANGLSIRGNNPASVRWRLEGVDVVNPNHLPNAGTFSDRPAAASGGVLMFSAQMLDNSSLLTGNYPAGYGDALGGIMDMNLRNGNTTRHEFTAQAGLIGLDMAAEGPMSGKGKNSYLVNYRYSTVGLLSQMGIPLGDEEIRFQDLSFKLHFSGKKGSEWTVFGMGGLNDNVFKQKTEFSEVKKYKDLFNIDFNSKTGVFGVANWSPLGAKTWLKTALVLSEQQNDRKAASDFLEETDEQQEKRLGLAITLQHRLSNQWRASAGGNIQRIYFSDVSMSSNLIRYTGEIRAHLWQPWMNWEWTAPRNQLTAQIGVHTNIYTAEDDLDTYDASVEPRASVNWRLNNRQRLTVAYGFHSQLNPLWLEADTRQAASDPAKIYPNRGSGLVRSRQLGLRHHWQWREDWSLKTELFWQKMSNIPVSTLDRTFSLFNTTEFSALDGIQTTGIAENKGVEINVEHYLTGNWFLVGNVTLFDSRYQGDDRAWRPSRWDLGHILNLTMGREWQREPPGKGKIKAFGINGRATFTGGYRAIPVDLAASRQAGETRYDTSNGWNEQLPAYFRLDLRVYWKRSLGNRRNSTFAMDFQNATMQKNVAYRYFDPFTDKVETKEQLGLIPNISWRLEF